MRWGDRGIGTRVLSAVAIVGLVSCLGLIGLTGATAAAQDADVRNADDAGPVDDLGGVATAREESDAVRSVRTLQGLPGAVEAVVQRVAAVHATLLEFTSYTAALTGGREARDGLATAPAAAPGSGPSSLVTTATAHLGRLADIGPATPRTCPQETHGALGISRTGSLSAAAAALEPVRPRALRLKPAMTETVRPVRPEWP